MYVCIYIYIYICVCVCVCMYVCLWIIFLFSPKPFRNDLIRKFNIACAVTTAVLADTWSFITCSLGRENHLFHSQTHSFNVCELLWAT